MQWEGILTMLLRLPRLLGLSREETVRPAVSVLRSTGFSRADPARRVVQQPLLLTCKPQRYQDTLGVMQEYGITIEVSLSP